MEVRDLSHYMAFLLRHKPETLNLNMDIHGWVDVQELMDKINQGGKGPVTMELLESVVAQDKKGRYRFSADKTRIKACQGHSISWVEPELQEKQPPACLYHGTTRRALEQIQASGFVSRMKRHAVHMQAEEGKAWLSARRWKGETPVVLKIDAEAMADKGYTFSQSENEVWFTESVPVRYICDILTD